MLVFVAIALGMMAQRALGASTDALDVFATAQVLQSSGPCSGTLVRIAHLPGDCFVPGQAIAPTGTATIFTPITRFVRFPLPAKLNGRGPLALVVSTYVTDGDVAVVDRSGALIATTHFGSTVPVADRPIRSHDIRVPLPQPFPPGATIVVRLTSPYAVPDVLAVQTAASLAATDDATLRNAGLAFAFLNGGALTMALFNLVLYGLLRRTIYLIYAAAIAALVFFQVVEIGTAWTLLWPHLGLRDDYPSYVAWVLYVALIVAFTRRMLNLEVVAPALDRALLIAFGVVVADSVVYVVIPDPLQKAGLYVWVDPLVTAAMVGLMLAAGIVAWRRRVSGALAYVVAFAGSAIGIVASDIAFYVPAFSTLPALAYLPTSYGVAWESVFLAAALGQRVRDAERDAARLSRFAFNDGLTGIANRRAFDDAIEREWNGLQRIGGTLAVVIFDIDHFKAFNDKFGHPAGDERLITVAQIIATAARRQGDLAARYGGEEFALLLPNTTLEAAFAIAEAVRQRVAESGEGELTVSAGVAVALTTHDASSVHALLVAADAALYAAKSSGRNRTVRWDTVLGGTAAHVGGG